MVERTIDDDTKDFLNDLKDEVTIVKKKGGKEEKIVIKKATIQLTDKEYTMMQIADINISQICSKLLRNYLNSKSVQENVRQKLGVINDYFSNQ